MPRLAELGPDARAVAARLAGASGPLTVAQIAAARRHRVHLLLAASLGDGDRRAPWAADLLRELRAAALLHGRREDVVRRVVETLAAAGADPLLMKGAGLAYTVYAEPHLRPRVDVDLLVARDAIARAGEALERDGWERDVESDAGLASTQRHYTRAGSHGETDRVDLHWKIANPAAFADALSFDELRARAVGVPALGASALTLAPADALFLACVHLVAHHGEDPPELLWLVDIHRLAGRLDAAERERVLELAARERMRAVCCAALEAACQYLGGGGAAGLVVALSRAAVQEPRARLIGPVPPAIRLGADLAALPTWRARAALLREHLAPSAAYLRSRYPGWPAVLLPFAALHRLAAGVPRWFKVPRRES